VRLWRTVGMGLLREGVFAQGKTTSRRQECDPKLEFAAHSMFRCSASYLAINRVRPALRFAQGEKAAATKSVQRLHLLLRIGCRIRLHRRRQFLQRFEVGQNVVIFQDW
jgi:hypothetical protein